MCTVGLGSVGISGDPVVPEVTSVLGCSSPGVPQGGCEGQTGIILSHAAVLDVGLHPPGSPRVMVSSWAG